MKLEKVILENFRSYKDWVEIDMTDLTAFVGKNDSGKSTVLEALEIFFNNKLVKIDPKDCNVYSENEFVRIGCVFSDVPNSIVIDSTATTNLENEYLLNSDKQLEIHKVFDCSKTTLPNEVSIVANYPTIAEASDLHILTQAKLKARVKELSLEDKVGDNRSNVSLRKAIFESITDLKLSPSYVSAKTGDVKSIWDSLKLQLPIYSLFQSDRPSLDGDSEVQDPMKMAVQAALLEVANEIEVIKNKVKKSALSIAEKTLTMLGEMDATLANELTPSFSEEPKFDKVFKLTLDGDDGIPINKRGSGVKRLILLSFFRAEVERQMTLSNDRGIIYGIEEPETSQHPHNQILLANTLEKLSLNTKTQIILTTHVPAFAGLLPTESLRYIRSIGMNKEIISADSDRGVIKEIANTLGVLPSLTNNVQVLVFVEGVNDIAILKTFSKLINSFNSSLVDLSNDLRVVLIPTGGSTLKEWVDREYLKTFNLPEVHIYDSDALIPPKYQETCEKVNARGDGSIAFSTTKREMENYINPKNINTYYDVNVSFTDTCSVPELVAKLVHEKETSAKPWMEVSEKKLKDKKNNVKRSLNYQVAETMTYEDLCESDKGREIEGWLQEITSRLSVLPVR